jgi:hypothetical protein
MNLDRDVEDDVTAKAKALRFKAKAIARRKTRKRRQQRGTPSATWHSKRFTSNLLTVCSS